MHPQGSLPWHHKPDSFLYSPLPPCLLHAAGPIPCLPKPEKEINQNKTNIRNQCSNPKHCANTGVKIVLQQVCTGGTNLPPALFPVPSNRSVAIAVCFVASF